MTGTMLIPKDIGPTLMFVAQTGTSAQVCQDVWKSSKVFNLIIHFNLNFKELLK